MEAKQQQQLTGFSFRLEIELHRRRRREKEKKRGERQVVDGSVGLAVFFASVDGT